MTSLRGESWPTPKERLQDQVQGDASLDYGRGRTMGRSGWSSALPTSLNARDLMGGLRVLFEVLFEEDFHGAWNAPRPLLNSPPKYRQHGKYYRKGTSVLMAGANDEDMGEGSGQPREPTDAERLQQARLLYDQMRQKAEALEQKVEQLEKGKGPGRDPLRRLGLRMDQYSLPQPDNYHGPMGTYPINRIPPMGDVKPILMDKPEPFEGANDDIERFLGDCCTYFEVFRRHYQEHPALKIVFTTSLLRGDAKNWWVHL